jgi:hypothetical protein
MQPELQWDGTPSSSSIRVGGGAILSIGTVAVVLPVGTPWHVPCMARDFGKAYFRGHAVDSATEEYVASSWKSLKCLELASTSGPQAALDH